MEQLQFIITNILAIIENYLFLVLVLKQKPINRKKKEMCLLLIPVLFYCLCLAFFPIKLLLFYIMQSFLILAIYALFEKKWTETLKLWTILFLFLSLWESLLKPILIIFIPNTSNFVRIACCALLAILMILIYDWLIGCKIYSFKWNNKLWGIFASALLLIELMITYFLTILDDLAVNRWIKLGSVVVLLGGFAVCIIIFSVVYYYNQKEEYRIQMEMLEKLNEQQKIYFNNLLEREESTRQFRHDIINHMLSLKTMSDVQDYPSLTNYVNEMTDELDTIIKKHYDIGNEIMNTILNYYLVPIKDECEITVEGYIGNIGRISQKDMCSLAANIVKNATEAVQNSKEKNINFQIEEGTHFIRMKVINTYSGKLEVDNQGGFKTTKKDQKNHGFGLQTIKQIVEKYQGKEQIQTCDGMFTIEVYLHI